MKIVSVVFGDSDYDRLARAFELSVRENCPDATLQIIHTDAHTIIPGIPEHCPANLQKMKLWRQAVQETPVGEELVLADCDMLILRDLKAAFSKQFDLAYTVRPHRVAINGGMKYMRISHHVRALVDKWVLLHELMVNAGADSVRHVDPGQRARAKDQFDAWIRDYAGLCQASFMKAIEKSEWPLKIIKLPCSIWNSVDQTWGDYRAGETAALHIKGKLRRLALSNSDTSKSELLGPLADLWRSYEQRSLTNVVR